VLTNQRLQGSDWLGDLALLQFAIGQLEFDSQHSVHYAVDRLWVEPISGFSNNPIARPFRELETCLVIRSSKL
jgi:hypothetical protein